MSKEQDFTELFQTFQKGLQHCSTEDLKEGILDVIKQKGLLRPQTSFVIDIVCREYNTSRSIIINKNSRGATQIARDMCYCLLHLELSLSVRHIAKTIFDRGNQCVFVAIKRFRNLDPKIKEHREFLRVYDKLKKEIEINLENKKSE